MRYDLSNGTCEWICIIEGRQGETENISITSVLLQSKHIRGIFNLDI